METTVFDKKASHGIRLSTEAKTLLTGLAQKAHNCDPERVIETLTSLADKLVCQLTTLEGVPYQVLGDSQGMFLAGLGRRTITLFDRTTGTALSGLIRWQPTPPESLLKALGDFSFE